MEEFMYAVTGVIAYDRAVILSCDWFSERNEHALV